MGLNGPLSFYSLCGQIYSKRVRLCVFDVRCIKYYKWNIQWNQGLWLSGYGGGGWGKRRGFDRNMGFVCTYSNTRTQAHQKDFAFVGLVTCVGYSRDPRDQLYVIKYSWLAMTPRSIICIHILEREKMKKKKLLSVGGDENMRICTKKSHIQHREHEQFYFWFISTFRRPQTRVIFACIHIYSLHIWLM